MSGGDIFWYGIFPNILAGFWTFVLRLPDEKGEYFLMWGIDPGVFIWTAMAIVVAIICGTILIYKRMEVAAELQKEEIKLKVKEVELLEVAEKEGGSQARREIDELRRELASIKHVNEIRAAKEAEGWRS